MAKFTSSHHFEIIQNCNLFKDINPAVYMDELKQCSVIYVDPEEILIDIDSENSKTYIVLSGSMSIHLEKIDNAPIRQVNVGETVGELSLLGETRATALVVVRQPCQLLVIPRQLLWGLIRKSAQISQNLLFILTDWIISDNERFIDRSREVESLKDLSQLDGLTGLMNRRELDKFLNRVYTRSQMSGNRFVVIMVDVDRFKNYNDTQGHQAGDQALIALGKVLKETIRPMDVAGRYGGEEFTVVLPESTAKEAMVVAERLRINVEKQEIKTKDGSPLPTITVSLGIAESAIDLTLEEIIIKADKNLYKAKKSGRNRCCM
ncbi:MAG: GGDEF domain-containing protein [Magnetococcales bacterium]|nr:GGDEF domain-containing protein [Magnetococcales bacterium]